MKRSVSRSKSKTKKVKKMKRVKSSNVYKTTSIPKASKVKFAEETRGNANINLSGDYRQPPPFETKNMYNNNLAAAQYYEEPAPNHLSYQSLRRSPHGAESSKSRGSQGRMQFKQSPMTNSMKYGSRDHIGRRASQEDFTTFRPNSLGQGNSL